MSHCVWRVVCVIAGLGLLPLGEARAETPVTGEPSAPSGAIVTPPASQEAKQETEAQEAAIRTRWTQLQTFLDQRDYPRALEFARETLAAATKAFGPQNGFTGVSARHVGQILMAQRKPAEAVPHFLQAFKVAAHIFSGETKHVQDASRYLARAYVQAGRFDDAVALYRHIVTSLVEKGAGDDLAVAIYRRELGRLLRRAGKPAEAAEAFEGALAVQKKQLGPQDFELIKTYGDLGGVYRVLGRFEKSVTAYRAALEATIATKGPDDINTGILMDNLGYALSVMSRFAEAEKMQRRALEIFEATYGPDHLTTALGRANLASLFKQQGRFREARPLFEQALAIYRAKLPESDPRIGVLLDNFAGLARSEGRREEAYALYQGALKSLTAAYPETHPEVVKALNNVALEEEARGNYERAEGLLERALAASEATFGKNYYGLGVILGNLGDVRIALKKAQPALDAFKRAVEIISSTVGPEHDDIISPMRSLAGFKLGLKRYDEALDHTRQAMRAEALRLERLRLDPDGGVRANGGNSAFTGALYVFDRVANVRPELRPSLMEEAFKAAQRAAETDAARSVAKIGARFATGDAGLSQLVRTRQDLAEDWAAANARLLEAATRPAAQRTVSDEQALRAKMAQLENDLADADRRLAETFPEYASLSNPEPVAISDIQEAIGPGEVVLQFAPQANTLHVFAITKTDAQWRKLETPYTTIAQRVHAVRCGLDQAEWVGETKPLKCLDALGRTPDARGVLPFDLEQAHALYRDLFAPFETLIEGRHLIVIPDAHLARLPLQVLITEPPGAGAPLNTVTWLARSNAVSVIPSLGSLKVLRETVRGRVRQAEAQTTNDTARYLALANPLLTGPTGDDLRALSVPGCRPDRPETAPDSYAVAGLSAPTNASAIVVRAGGSADVRSVRRLEPLPDTVDEVCEVARTLGVTAEHLLIGEAATENRLKSLNRDGRLDDYRILHFATHGLVTGEVRGLAEPALVLTPPAQAQPHDDGLLTASEVAELQLDADWVVLSACNTAAGQSPGAEALSGLGRAFIYAGARALLVSHWPVQSAAAVRLTTATFRAMRVDPALGRAEALRQAMVALIDDPAVDINAHPQIWAPFVVVGDAGPVALPEGAPVPARVLRPSTAAEVGATRGTAARASRLTPRRVRRRAPRTAPPAPPPSPDDWRTRAFQAR